jgi:tetratricopeptide (TPR) repeat protein
LIGNLPEAESLCVRALALARTDHDLQTEARAYSCLGHVHFQRGNGSLGIEYANKALKLENELGNFEGASHDLNSLAAYYCESGEYEKAIENMANGRCHLIGR